ncbi:hypothetical protein [Terriglobus sp. TAA 43]|uniref:hypothetical protein n=1 Tax=Terriglobus sp. TAA 43 TaxID=278961 RepID=UPI0012EEAE47|nr:hypothetical protein [Terriglobus sp. TAA 43]
MYSKKGISPEGTDERPAARSIYSLFALDCPTFSAVSTPRNAAFSLLLLFLHRAAIFDPEIRWSIGVNAAADEEAKPSLWRTYGEYSGKLGLWMWLIHF